MIVVTGQSTATGPFTAIRTHCGRRLGLTTASAPGLTSTASPRRAPVRKKLLLLAMVTTSSQRPTTTAPPLSAATLQSQGLGGHGRSTRLRHSSRPQCNQAPASREKRRFLTRRLAGLRVNFSVILSDKSSAQRPGQVVASTIVRLQIFQ
jgi:hypothetical protein